MHMLDANSLGALGLLVSDAMAADTAPHSLSAASALLALHYRRSLTATALAPVMGVRQPTAVRVIGGLERQGLITRTERQGRDAPFCLTHLGEEVASALQQRRLAALDRLLAPLSVEERMQFKALADRLLIAATDSRRTARHLCRLCDHKNCDGPACPVGCRATALERVTE